MNDDDDDDYDDDDDDYDDDDDDDAGGGGVVVVVVVVVLSEASGLSSFIVELATRWRPISCIQIQYMLSCCATYNLECELADYIIYTLGCVVQHGAIQQMVTF